MNELTVIPHERPLDAYRMSTDAAGVCGEIVKRTAKPIQGRKYVTVEGWQAIAIAHGCTASADHVERVNDEGASGFKATGIVRRMSDGQEIARAEGFLGDDENTWSKRPVYARRAMVQTRAISRACRSAFAHVVVMIDAGLSTTPAEEITYDVETGEVLEDDPARREPAAREKLDGPHTSKTALRKAVNDIIAIARKAESLADLEKIKHDHKRTINQALRDWPLLVNGNPDIAEDLGLKGEIEKRRAELDTSLSYQFLASLVEASKSTDDLASLLDEHSEAIQALDGAESRRFEELYNAKETALTHPTPMTAGAFGG